MAALSISKLGRFSAMNALGVPYLHYWVADVELVMSFLDWRQQRWEFFLQILRVPVVFFQIFFSVMRNIQYQRL